MTIEVLVDWDNNGNYTGTYDDITADVKSVNWRVGMREAYQEMADENTAKVIVNNATGKYNPENSSSVLYGNLLPHRRMQIKMDSVIMWTGWIAFPVVNWTRMGAQSGKYEAELTGIGAKRFLDKLEATISLQSTVTGDTIIQSLLTDSDLDTISTDFTQIDTGDVDMDYFGDGQASSTFQSIADVTRAERGRFYIDRQGRAAWWNRSRLLQPAAYTPVATVNTASGSYKPTSLNYGYGRYIANLLRVESQQRVVKASETLFELENSITTSPGTTTEFEVRLRRESGQFAAATSLVATPTFSSGTASVSIAEKGGKAVVTIDNTSGGVDAVLSALTIAGAPTVETQQIVTKAEDTTSQSTYGKIEYTINLGPFSAYSRAQSVAAFELSRRKEAVGDVSEVSFVRNADGTDNAHMTAWELGDRLTVTVDEIGHSSDYFIIGESHDWRPGDDGNGIHATTYRLEAAIFNTFWLLEVTNYGELGQNTILGV